MDLVLEGVYFMNWLKNYINTNPLISFNNCKLTVEDILIACLIGKINILFVSERGEGKTQILYDVLYGVFGGRGNYIRCTPDMEIKDIFTAINLDKLRRKEGTTEDVIEMTDALRNPFTGIDELNRAPPIVQNQLLQILDGYIEVSGKRHPIGINIDSTWYHESIATVNIEGNRYLGTFGIDAAILDRFGVILDLDHFSPLPTDVLKVLTEELGVSLNETEEDDRIQEIQKLHKIVMAEEVPLEVLLGVLYLREGVDFLSREPFSQRKVKGELEGVHELGGLQGIMKPISMRTAKQLIHLYKALNVLTRIFYGKETEGYFENFVSLLPLVLPYSGSLRRSKVDTLFYGNPVLAVNKIQEEVMIAFQDKEMHLVTAIKKLKEGILKKRDLRVFKNEFKFFREILEQELRDMKRSSRRGRKKNVR